MTRVKLCGITSAAARDAAVAAGADALGFLVEVTVESPRQITANEAAELIDGVPPFVSTVLVTMAADGQRLRTLVDQTGCDTIQLHGEWAPTELRSVVPSLPVSVLVATTPTSRTAVEAGEVADGLLVDALDENGAGGTGRTPDWDAARDLVRHADAPVVLAGGLTPANVQAALEAVEPYGVDVSSGIEDDSGAKSPAAMQAFVRRATDELEARA